MSNTSGKTPVLSLCENPTHICHRLICWHPSQHQQLLVFSSASHPFTAAFQMGHPRGSLFYHSYYASKAILKSVILESKWFRYSLFLLLFLSWLPKQQTKAIASKTHCSLEYIMQYSSSQILMRDLLTGLVHVCWDSCTNKQNKGNANLLAA